MCLPLQDGRTPRPLQEKATTKPWPQPVQRACESKAEDAALEIAAEFLLDVARHGPLGAVATSEPVLEVLGDGPVQWRLLGPPPLVELQNHRAVGHVSDMPHRPVVECGDLQHVTFREKKKAGAEPAGTAPAAQNNRADRATTPVGQSPAGLLAGLPRSCVKFRRAVAARLSRTEKEPTHADADVAARDAFRSRCRRDTAGGRLRRGRPAMAEEMCEGCEEACEQCVAECTQCGDEPCCKASAAACKKCHDACGAMRR